jgi:hypothetical protein
VAELSVDEDQVQLTVTLDGPHVLLDHHRLAGLLEAP